MNSSHPISDVAALGRQARTAAAILANCASAAKNAALIAIAHALSEREAELLAANQQDLQAGKENGLSAPLLDRLQLAPAQLRKLADGLAQVASLPDPVGDISELTTRPNGLQIGKMRVPLGVVGMIYESRPNVTVEAASLCLKSGNAVILRGGSEAIHSNRALEQAIQQGLREAELPQQAVQLVQTTDRAAVGELISMPDCIDIIIPRGGKGLIERVASEARVPVLKHLDGNCHLFIDAEADAKTAIALAVNAKTRRFGVCNALETLLIDASMAAQLLPPLKAAFDAKEVSLRGCPQTTALIDCTAASEEDWYSEFLGPVLAVKVVADLTEAIAHINHYGSHHTDSIVTPSYSRGRQFLRQVDSASVMINASTAFADGFEYGLGAEIGISTDKLHARGPVGLLGLTSEKYIVLGDGQIRIP